MQFDEKKLKEMVKNWLQDGEHHYQLLSISCNLSDRKQYERFAEEFSHLAFGVIRHAEETGFLGKRVSPSKTH